MKATYDFRNRRESADGTIVDVVRIDSTGEKQIATNYSYSESRLIIDMDKLGLEKERVEAERDVYKKVVLAVKGGLYTKSELKQLARDAVGIVENLQETNDTKGNQ